MSDKKNYEITRAVFHVGGSLILIRVFDYVKPSLIIASLFLLILLIELIRLRNNNINNYITKNKYFFWNKIIRDEEKNEFSALMTVSFGFLLISWLPLRLLKIAILINGFADPSARIFGIKWGAKKILNTKNSFIGSFAFFVAAFLVCVFFALPLFQTLIVSLIGTAAEFMPDKKPFWVDNLRIPVFVGLVLRIMM